MNIDKIQGSPSLEIVNLVLNKKAKGENVLSLAIGDPSSDTPMEIIEAASRSMNAGRVHYTSSYGTVEVREAICRKVGRKNRIRCEISNAIFLTTKFAVYAALSSVSTKEFEALVPDPGYFYSEPVTLAGGTPVRYGLAGNFELDLDEIKKKTTANTKAIVLNTPSNPTGKVLPKNQLQELLGFCAEKEIYIISDEAYEDLVYEKEHFSIGSLETHPGVVISLFSLSKSYSMTGWRAGYIVASNEIISLINKFVENTITSFPTFIQDACAFALDNCEKQISVFKEEYRKKRNLLSDLVREVKQFSLEDVEGAFYAFPIYSLKRESTEICKEILQRKNVALLPGIAFGPKGEGHVRFSFSASENVIQGAMTLVKDYFRNEFA